MDNFGFLKVAAAVPHVRVADCDYNTERMAAMAEEAARRGVEIVAFPELGVTAYTCGDLLLQQTLLDAADEALERLVRATRKLPLTLIAGAPLRHGSTLYNCAVVFTQGKVLGVVPKTYIPDYGEFYENRWFASGAGISDEHIAVAGQQADFGADLTIMEEGSEFVDRFTHRERYTWPMFTSCCPGWVRFLKGQFPDYTDNLSTAKSPQQMFGALAKSYFAEKIGVDPKRIFVVSIMPCIAKKSEAALPTMRTISDDPDVDVVLTTREIVRMFRGEQINPATMEETPFDSPLGTGTGAAVIFGASGGVMDAALRSAYYLVTGSNPDPDAFSAIRGVKGWKEATFTIPKVGDLSVAVVSGLSNARQLMTDLEEGRVHYDFVEVMACPGGCAGGGGQPIHDGTEMAEARGNVLWSIDKKSPVRFSHENPEVQTLYREYLRAPLSGRSHHLLHTDHEGWKMPNQK